jgi:hypothetical protein
MKIQARKPVWPWVSLSFLFCTVYIILISPYRINALLINLVVVAGLVSMPLLIMKILERKLVWPWVSLSFLFFIAYMLFLVNPHDLGALARALGGGIGLVSMPLLITIILDYFLRVFSKTIISRELFILIFTALLMYGVTMHQKALSFTPWW